MNKYRTRTALFCLQVVALVFLSGCQSGSSDTAEPTGNNPPPPGSNSAPTISGTPATSVLVEQEYSFTPSATDANGDSLTFSVQAEPDWLAINSTTGRLSGTPGMENVGTYSGIVVSVSDASVSASLPEFSLDVVQNANGSVTLMWVAPTQNTDGSTVDLAAYKFYFGTSPGSYSNQVRVDSPGITSYVLGNLSPATYYIVATAINSDDVESDMSNVTTVTVG